MSKCVTVVYVLVFWLSYKIVRSLTLRHLKVNQRAPKRTAIRPKEHLKGPQEDPKEAQGAPKTTQDCQEATQASAKTPPGALQDWPDPPGPVGVLTISCDLLRFLAISCEYYSEATLAVPRPATPRILRGRRHEAAGR